jgi:hypothetical protein
MSVYIEFENGNTVESYEGTERLARAVFQSCVKELQDYPSVTMALGIVSVSLVEINTKIEVWTV